MDLLAVAVLVLLVLDLVNAGAFLAFATMVSPAFRDTRDQRAAADLMRDMNALAPRSIFMVSFVGAPLTAVVAGVLLVTGGGAASAPWIIGAIVPSLLAFVVSAVGNIPWNERLARARDDGTTWAEFSPAWARANTLRCALSVVAGASAGVALL